MKTTMSRRKTQILRYTLLTAGSVLLATSLFFALKPDRPEYRPGQRVEGLTFVLDREIPAEYPPVVYRETAREAGVRFQHFWRERSTQLPEDMGSGAAWGDYNNNGYFDLYLVNKAGPLTLSPEELAQSRAHNRLFQNRGDGTFVDVTDEAGVGFRGVGMAAAWGDFDDDGHLDLVTTNYGPIVLYRNRGDGTFDDASRETGVAGFEGFWAGATWCDYNRNGLLDLYICGYVQYDYDPEDMARSTVQYEAVVPFTLNPSSYPPERNLLFRNEGGRFREVAEEVGVANEMGRSLAAACCDLNGDGWPEIYVANDISDNVLYRRAGDGRMEDVSHRAWVADYRGSMGLALGDWDNDGDIDMFITHWIAQENAFFDNTRRFAGLEDPEKPTLQFFDIADQVGLGQIALPYIGWGASFLDYDNDGREDLLVVNGSTFQLEEDPRKLAPMRSQLFWNKGPEEGFFELGEVVGDVFSTPWVGRGLAVADYDNDGGLDAVIVVHGGPALLLRNEGANRRNWLKVRASGGDHNYFGFGARVEVYDGDSVQTQIINSQPSYLSQNAHEAHFGLGDREWVERVVVRFPCGHVKERSRVGANQTLLIREDRAQ
jgi:enediyne biosynthesis protein E4